MGDIVAFFRRDKRDPLEGLRDQAIAKRTKLYAALIEAKRAQLAAERAWRLADDAVHDLNRRIANGEGPGAA